LEALQAGNASEAIRHFTAAASADPSAAALWINLAKAQRLAGDNDAERAALERALELDQVHLMALIRLAELHERLGEMGSATDRWNLVLGLCAKIANPTPELNAMMAHARDFIVGQQEALAAALQDSLAETLGGASERDRRRA
jgi:tetratricopeptide (TPR) repeat protein